MLTHFMPAGWWGRWQRGHELSTAGREAFELTQVLQSMGSLLVGWGGAQHRHNQQLTQKQQLWAPVIRPEPPPIPSKVRLGGRDSVCRQMQGCALGSRLLSQAGTRHSQIPALGA